MEAHRYGVSLRAFSLELDEGVKIVSDVIYQKRVRVFHQGFQTPRK